MAGGRFCVELNVREKMDCEWGLFRILYLLKFLFPICSARIEHWPLSKRHSFLHTEISTGRDS